MRIGAKTVIGQECTISAFQHVSIGRECIVADRVMLIDFDHGVVEVERPIRLQGIYKRDVRVGHNVWIGYGACVLRGVTVGDNAILGTYTVVTKDIPDNAVAAGVPGAACVRDARRRRDAPAAGTRPGHGVRGQAAPRRGARESARPRRPMPGAVRRPATASGRRGLAGGARAAGRVLLGLGGAAAGSPRRHRRRLARQVAGARNWYLPRYCARSPARSRPSGRRRDSPRLRDRTRRAPPLDGAPARRRCGPASPAASRVPLTRCPSRASVCGPTTPSAVRPLRALEALDRRARLRADRRRRRARRASPGRRRSCRSRRRCALRPARSARAPDDGEREAREGSGDAAAAAQAAPAACGRRRRGARARRAATV